MTTSRAALIGAAWGFGAGVLLCLLAWLSPLAASDRAALALLAVTVSLPLGCMVGVRGADPFAVGLSGVTAALALAMVVSVFDPALFVRTASWCLAGGVIGVSVAALVRGGGVLATAFWLVLCALPFFYDRLPVLQTTAETWAMQGCPWLGFASDAIGGDPLRRPVLYLGHWTELSSHGSMDLLKVSTLWLAAVPALAAMLIGGRLKVTARATATQPE